MKTKVDVPAKHYDLLFTPVACVVSITTVDPKGRVNAASFATCVRVHHEPTCIAFCVDSHKDTYRNVLATNEFVVNIPSFDREILEKVRTLGLPFPPGRQRAGKSRPYRASADGRQTDADRRLHEPFRMPGGMDQAVVRNSSDGGRPGGRGIGR